MKRAMAVAVFVIFAAATFGQAIQPPQPTQPPQRQVVPRQPLVRAELIPNWPANKPAPIVQIPTEVRPQSRPLAKAPQFVPSLPSQPCAIYIKNCRLIAQTPRDIPKAQKRTMKPAFEPVYRENLQGTTSPANSDHDTH